MQIQTGVPPVQQEEGKIIFLLTPPFMVGYEQPKISTSLSNIRKVTIKMILDKLRIIVSGGGLV